MPRQILSGYCLSAALLATLFLAGEAIPQEVSESRNPREYFFAQTFGDLPEELEEAKNAGKHGLFLFFEQDGCAFCQKMMQSVLNQREVQEWYGEYFVNIAVDIRGDIELRDVDGITLPSKVFARHRKVKFTPVMSFLDLNGVEVFRKSGMIASPEEFLLMGRYVVDKHYTDTSFNDFMAKSGYEKSDPTLHTPAKGN